MTRAFIDTNVVLYLLSGDAKKANRSEEIIAAGGVASVQVLSEFVSVARRKLNLAWTDIRSVLTALEANLDIPPITLPMHALALDIAERFGLNICDATIIAAAVETGCKKVLTEDLQRGQIIEGVRIETPYP